MSGVGYTAPPSQADIAALAQQVASKADASAMPQPASQLPQPEKTGAAVGAQQQRFALEDHQHPRLTSTIYATLDGSGQATVAFTRTFVNKPGLNLTETDATASSQELILRGLAWQRDANGLYTGVTIQGRRAQMLPTLTLLSGTLALLSAVVSGVNAIVTALSGFNVFSGPAAGATVSVIAIARSDVVG